MVDYYCRKKPHLQKRLDNEKAIKFKSYVSFYKNIKVTIVEPGGARTQFRYGSAKVANLTPEYEHVHGFLTGRM
jgi:hypothetical protein